VAEARGKRSSVNWGRGLFRLWSVLAICWIVGSVYFEWGYLQAEYDPGIMAYLKQASARSSSWQRCAAEAAQSLLISKPFRDLARSTNKRPPRPNLEIGPERQVQFS
jgi:hypothetical protein